MKKAAFLRIMAVLLALGGIWGAQTQQPPANLTMEKLADDLHVIIGDGGNVAVLTTEEGVILVDDKFDRDVPQIVAKVKSITDKPIKYVINTHQHGDHTGGNHALLTSTEIFAHKNARTNMVKNSQPGAPRVSFADELALNLGGKEVRAKYFGTGHTNGDAVIYFPAHKIIHTGDLFVRGMPFIDYDSGGNSEGWIKTLDGVISSLDFDTVIPGHGAVSKRDDIRKWKADFETVRSRMRELTRQGKSKEEVASLLKVDDLPGWRVAGLFQKSLPAFYDEMARAR